MRNKDSCGCNGDSSGKGRYTEYGGWESEYAASDNIGGGNYRANFGRFAFGIGAEAAVGFEMTHNF